MKYKNLAQTHNSTVGQGLAPAKIIGKFDGGTKALPYNIKYNFCNKIVGTDILDCPKISHQFHPSPL